MEFMMKRHSVRQYEDKRIEDDKRTILKELIKKCNQEGNLNIQIFFDEPKCFDSMMAHYGSFTGVQNYIALVGPKSDSLDEKLGYYGEQIVLKAQELGLNTCWAAMTHGKSAALIEKGEKEGCLISLGYGKTQGVPHKSKSLEKVSNCTNESPEWFIKGVEAVLLAPTAVNQQKFYFALNGEEVSANVKGVGFYTNMDLGIAKYHFERATGRKIK